MIVESSWVSDLWLLLLAIYGHSSVVKLLFLKNYCQLKSFFSEMLLVQFDHLYSKKLTATNKGQGRFIEIFLYAFPLRLCLHFYSQVCTFSPLLLKNTKVSWKYFYLLGTWRALWSSNIDKSKARIGSMKLLSLMHGTAQNQKSSFPSKLWEWEVSYLFTFYLTFSFTQSTKNWLAGNI